VSRARASYLADAFAMGVEGAAPVLYRGVDLRERPDNPEHRFHLTVDWGTVVACVGDEDSGVGDLGRWAMSLGNRPPSGDVLVFGTDMRTLSYQDMLLFRRRMGYLQTGDGLLQNLNLRGNISLPLQYASDHRMEEVNGRVDVLLEQFRLQPVANLRPAAANEEERRRAAVARAIALDPELLVMEAPFDGLTGRAARELIELARGRTDGSPRTILLTAQDLGPSVAPVIDRVVRLVDGLAVEDA
jgi:ABC-type transporter Mla maintaining outer membrane lipid asymmetry ATPase subunit MlaF